MLLCVIKGYNDILLIPAGATNIKVQEIKASNNYLGKTFIYNIGNINKINECL